MKNLLLHSLKKKKFVRLYSSNNNDFLKKLLKNHINKKKINKKKILNKINSIYEKFNVNVDVDVDITNRKPYEIDIDPSFNKFQIEFNNFIKKELIKMKSSLETKNNNKVIKSNLNNIKKKN